jgi:spore maturation protein CgeB
MRDLRRYLTHPYYWRRAIQRLVETVVRRQHLETHLDVLIPDVQQVRPRGDHVTGSVPGAGLRLLYVAPKFDYGNRARGYSYEENHFRPALADLGFDLITFDSLTIVRRLGRKAAGELLVEVAYRARPDVAFFVLFKDDVDPAAVDEIRRMQCVTFNWFTDDHWRFDAFSSRWAPRFTWAVTTDPKAVVRYRDRGITNVIRSQWGVNHRLYRPLDLARRFDVTFIGQPHGDRRAVLRTLRDAGIAVQAWGYGWPGGKISTRQAVEVINESAVNLNLSNASIKGVDQIKGRDFEVPACRAFLLTRRVEALDEYYALGSEVVVYDDLEDLQERIRWALAHPAEVDRVREAGYRRVLQDHTYQRRFSEIFRLAGVLP